MSPSSRARAATARRCWRYRPRWQSARPASGSARISAGERCCSIRPKKPSRKCRSALTRSAEAEEIDRCRPWRTEIIDLNREVDASLVNADNKTGTIKLTQMFHRFEKTIASAPDRSQSSSTIAARSSPATRTTASSPRSPCVALSCSPTATVARSCSCRIRRLLASTVALARAVRPAGSTRRARHFHVSSRRTPTTTSACSRTTRPTMPRKARRSG